MLIRHRNEDPVVDPSAYVAPNATLVGRVVVGPRARIMYGAVIDAEGSRVELGEATIVCENAVLRASAVTEPERPVTVADHVFVGPHATVLGSDVERCAYLAAGVTVLHSATIGAGANIAVGALVHANTVVPTEYFVPPNTLAVGDPVQVVTPDRVSEVADAIRSADFASTAFGVRAQWEDRLERYEQATEVRSSEFAAHQDDVILD